MGAYFYCRVSLRLSRRKSRTGGGGAVGRRWRVISGRGLLVNDKCTLAGDEAAGRAKSRIYVLNILSNIFIFIIPTKSTGLCRFQSISALGWPDGRPTGQPPESSGRFGASRTQQSSPTTCLIDCLIISIELSARGGKNYYCVFACYRVPFPNAPAAPRSRCHLIGI